MNFFFSFDYFLSVVYSFILIPQEDVDVVKFSSLSQKDQLAYINIYIYPSYILGFFMNNIHIPICDSAIWVLSWVGINYWLAEIIISFIWLSREGTALWETRGVRWTVILVSTTSWGLELIFSLNTKLLNIFMFSDPLIRLSPESTIRI